MERTTITSTQTPALSLNVWGVFCSLSLVGALMGCQPTVKVEAPREPITINLNIKLDADVRVKVEEEAKRDIEANPDIF